MKKTSYFFMLLLASQIAFAGESLDTPLNSACKTDSNGHKTCFAAANFTQVTPEKNTKTVFNPSKDTIYKYKDSNNQLVFTNIVPKTTSPVSVMNTH